MKYRGVRLYELTFPVWFLFLLPPAWKSFFPMCFLLDSLVLLIAALAMKMPRPVVFYLRHILQVFVLGLAAYFLAIMLLMATIFGLNVNGEDMNSPVLMIPTVLVAGGLIYLSGRYLSFRGCEMSQRKKLSLILAITTAPYAFLLPPQ